MKRGGKPRLHQTWLIQERVTTYDEEGKLTSSKAAYLKIFTKPLSIKPVNKWGATTFKTQDKAQRTIDLLIQQGFDKISNGKIEFTMRQGPEEIL